MPVPDAGTPGGSSFGGLPEVVELQILRFLDFDGLVRYEECSRGMRGAVQSVWRESSTALDNLYKRREKEAFRQGKRSGAAAEREGTQPAVPGRRLSDPAHPPPNLPTTPVTWVGEGVAWGQQQGSAEDGSGTGTATGRGKSEAEVVVDYYARLICGVKKGVADREGVSMERSVRAHQWHCRFGALAQKYAHFTLLRFVPEALRTRRQLDASCLRRFVQRNETECKDAFVHIFKHALAEVAAGEKTTAAPTTEDAVHLAALMGHAVRVR